MPTFFASIIIYMPWNPLVLAFLIALLYVLSLLSYRMNAALQVNEMIYFVQKAFEDLPPVVIPELPAPGADVVVTTSDFSAEWARFYREHSET
jgi:hypothetical protein